MLQFITAAESLFVSVHRDNHRLQMMALSGATPLKVRVDVAGSLSSVPDSARQSSDGYSDVSHIFAGLENQKPLTFQCQCRSPQGEGAGSGRSDTGGLGRRGGGLSAGQGPAERRHGKPLRLTVSRQRTVKGRRDHEGWLADGQLSLTGPRGPRAGLPLERNEDD